MVCTAISAVVVIAWLVMAATLKPYLELRLTQYFDVYSYLAYRLTVPALGLLGLGCLIPSLASLWVDIRVLSTPARRVLLALGLLGLCYYLIWIAWCLSLWPHFLYDLEPMKIVLQYWFAPLLSGDHEFLRLGPLFFSGGFLFLALNR